MGVGVEAGNFFTHTSSLSASSCDEQLPANRQENDVAGNSLRFHHQDQDNSTTPRIRDYTRASLRSEKLRDIDQREE